MLLTERRGYCDIEASSQINPLYSVGLFHCYLLDESICQFRGSGLFCRLCYLMDNPVIKLCRPDQTPNNVVSDRGLNGLRVSR